jgi:hypothetical protein
METARPVLERLRIDFDCVVIVTRDQVRFAKPDPDLFLTAAERLGVEIETASVVGDSVWDMLASRRARAGSVYCLGGYGPGRAGARGSLSRLRRPRQPLKSHRGSRSPMIGSLSGRDPVCWQQVKQESSPRETDRLVPASDRCRWEYRHDNYVSGPADGSAWLRRNDPSYPVVRGGSWLNDPQAVRAAVRARRIIGGSTSPGWGSADQHPGAPGRPLDRQWCRAPQKPADDLLATGRRRNGAARRADRA